MNGWTRLAGDVLALALWAASSNAVAAQPVPPRFPAAGTLRVEIVDASAHRIPNVKVWVDWLVGIPEHYHGNPNVVAATTDAEGVAIFNALPATGILILIATDAVGWARTDPIRTDLVAGVDSIVVIRVPKEAPLHGVVVDASGDPVSGVTVQLREAEGWMPDPPNRRYIFASLETDDDGRFTFTSLRPGRYVAEVERETALLARLVLSAPNNDVRIQLRERPTTSRVAFDVSDALKPKLERCELWGPGFPGSFAPANVESTGLSLSMWPGPGRADGRCRLSANKQSFRWAAEFRVEEGQTKHVLIQQPQGVDLRGSVVDAKGRPLVKADVAVAREGALAGDFIHAQTNDAGDFLLEGLEDAPYSLSVYTYDLRMTFQTIRPGKQGLRMTLIDFPKVVGSVVDSSGNAVEVLEVGEAFRSRYERGRLDLRISQYPSTTTLTIWSDTAGARRLPLGESARIDFATIELESERAVRGRVIDGTTGAPIVSALLEPAQDAWMQGERYDSIFEYVGGEDLPRSVRSDGNGDFVMPHAVPHIPIRISMHGYVPATRILQRDSVVALERGPVVEGLVRGAHEATCIDVGMENWNGGSANIVTDAAGRFRIWSLVAGRIELRRGCGGEGPAVEVDLENGVTSRIELP